MSSPSDRSPALPRSARQGGGRARCKLAPLLLVLGACEADTVSLDPLGDPPAGCRELEPTIETGTLEGEPRFSQDSAADVAGGLVFTHRGAFDPARKSTIAIDDADARLLDANDGIALYATASQILRWEGETTRAIAETEFLVPGDFDAAYRGRESTQVDRSSAAWREGEGVYRWDLEDAPRSIGRSAGSVESPSVGSGRVAWSEFGPEGARILVHARGDGEPTVIANGDAAHPALGDTQLFFVRAGALVRYDFDSKTIMPVHEGRCGPPSADGDRAVAACGGDNEWPAPGKFIVYWDGVRAHELFGDGGYHYAPRLDRGRIAWIRYQSTDVVCTPPRDEAVGEVRLWDPDASDEPAVLGRIGAPCLCCDAIWPPAEIGFEGDVIAWNYALEEGAQTDFVGWALYQRREACP
jgi:hypothetical protein